MLFVPLLLAQRCYSSSGSTEVKVFAQEVIFCTDNSIMHQQFVAADVRKKVLKKYICALYFHWLGAKVILYIVMPHMWSLNSNK